MRRNLDGPKDEQRWVPNPVYIYERTIKGDVTDKLKDKTSDWYKNGLEKTKCHALKGEVNFARTFIAGNTQGVKSGVIRLC